MFDESTIHQTDLVLIGTSHLSNITGHVNQDEWRVIDLTRPGWPINSKNVATMTPQVTATAAEVNMESATVILQLFDNSV